MTKETAEAGTHEAREALRRSLQTEIKSKVGDSDQAKVDEVRMNFVRFMLHGD